MNKMSKGEQKVARLLFQAGFRFKQEVSFKNLNGSHGKPLRFDFAIYNKQGKFLACLEVDGQQHFQFTPYFHKSKADFRRQLEWDCKKNKFCLLNNIPLIRIPYWDLEELTLEKIFGTSSYLVKSKDHNLMLMQRR